MKIAIIYDLPYPYHVGGAERRFWEIARRLAGRGHEVTFFSMQMWEGPAEMVRDGVRCVGVCAGVPAFTSKGVRSAKEPVVFARHLYRCLRGRQFDVIDCAEMPYLGAIAVRLAIRGLPTKLAVTWHEARGWGGWVRYNGWTGAIAAGFERVVSRLTPWNIAISDDTASRCRRILGMGGMAVVGCGVDPSPDGEPGHPPREEQVLHVGRLVRHKQADWAIGAFAAVARERPGLTLRIVGSGYEEPALRTLAESLGVAERVTFAGRVDDDTLRREYARSRALLFPSCQEGFGMVLIEAMAAGTPVIALEHPDSAARTVVRDGESGMLVRTRGEMEVALRRVLSDDALWGRLSRGGQVAAQAHGWDTAVIPAIEAFYRRIAGIGDSDGHA